MAAISNDWIMSFIVIIVHDIVTVKKVSDEEG